MKSSFHFFVTILTTLLSAAIFSLALSFSSLKIFLILLLLFLVTLSLLFVLLNQQKRKEHTLTLTLCTAISTMLLLSILEDAVIRWFFVGVGSLLLGILFGAKENNSIKLKYARKPFRRFVMMVWVFNAYALFSFLFALGVFFQSEWPVWLEIILVPLSGIIGGFIAGEIWKMYLPHSERRFLFFRIIVAAAISQIFWSLRLLPFGYLISSLPLTWIWYILQILIRFHFQEAGIVWKKQFPFLIVSGMIFLLLALFFVRWI